MHNREFEQIVIVDVGAANGFNSEAWTKYKDFLKIVMFEPDQRSFQNILKSQKCMIFNSALGEKQDRKKLNLTRKPEVSSFYEPNREYLDLFPNKSRWDILNVLDLKTEPLDFFKEEIGVMDFIKLDTQGSELEILRGAKQILKGCLGIEVEVEFIEIYKDQPLFGDVCQYLSNEGFEFYDFITEYRYGRKELNRKGQLAFADALFLRTPEYVHKFLPSAATKYLYVCAAYNKYDLIEVSKDLFNESEVIISVADSLLSNQE